MSNKYVNTAGCSLIQCNVLCIMYYSSVFSCEASSTYCNLTHSRSHRQLAPIRLLEKIEPPKGKERHAGTCRDVQGIQGNTVEYRGILGNSEEYMRIKGSTG